MYVQALYQKSSLIKFHSTGGSWLARPCWTTAATCQCSPFSSTAASRCYASALLVSTGNCEFGIQCRCNMGIGLGFGVNAVADVYMQPMQATLDVALTSSNSPAVRVQTGEKFKTLFCWLQAMKDLQMGNCILYTLVQKAKPPRTSPSHIW